MKMKMVFTSISMVRFLHFFIFSLCAGVVAKARRTKLRALSTAPTPTPPSSPRRSGAAAQLLTLSTTSRGSSRGDGDGHHEEWQHEEYTQRQSLLVKVYHKYNYKKIPSFLRLGLRAIPPSKTESTPARIIGDRGIDLHC